ncbi:MAG TPA: 50S ribosomal protein L11 methyltransferase [Dehalococcoidia bacterium]|nr:50S ribosomal protein L11 methyltransferase [Dehalococcoidia bacterium]
MDWLELAAEAPAEQVEALYTALGEVAGGASIEEPVVPLGPEEGVRREPWRPSTVRVYLPCDAHLAERRAAAHAAVVALPFQTELRERTVHEQDWANALKDFFQVERVGRRLVVRPSWRDHAAQPGEVVLDLDPGMAFGTGQHETTRMCLLAVEELTRPGMRVLDLGCGSGILGIAAALLGAAEVVAVDTEAVAIEVTADNARRNGVAPRLRAAEGSLDERWPFGPSPERAFDLVLANIHAAAAIALAPNLFSALQPGGTLIASGIIAERLEAVLAALSLAGFNAAEVRTAGDWRTVIAPRP